MATPHLDPELGFPIWFKLGLQTVYTHRKSRTSDLEGGGTVTKERSWQSSSNSNPWLRHPKTGKLLPHNPSPDSKELMQ